MQSSRKSQLYQERCVDPVEPQCPHPGSGYKFQHRDANGNATKPEAVTFLPAKAEPRVGWCTCGPCTSVGSCRKFVCSVLTCGLYRFCRSLPCLPSAAPVEEPEAPCPVSSDPGENSFYTDLYIGGVKVDPSVLEEDRSVSPSKKARDSPTYLSGSMDFGEQQDDGASLDVDSLITQKLLEVFSEFEINELAKCTSDSMFLKRSQEISQLISDIVQEHHIQEQEAECRLVREIIRISTRKSKKTPVQKPEPQRDSGNDTWRSHKGSSFKGNSINSMSGGSLKISEERSDDVEARKLRNNSNQSYSSSSAVPQSPGYQVTISPITSNTPLLSSGASA